LINANQSRVIPNEIVGKFCHIGEIWRFNIFPHISYVAYSALKLNKIHENPPFPIFTQFYILKQFPSSKVAARSSWRSNHLGQKRLEFLEDA
jgi:hypothetical protein